MTAPLQAEVVGGLTALDPDWDRLAHASACTSGRAYLGAVDGPGTFRVQVRRGDRLLAAMPGWRSDGHGHSWLEPAQVLAPLGVTAQRPLIVGAPWAFGGELLLDPEAGEDVVAALVAALREHAADTDADGIYALHLDDRSMQRLAACASAPVLLEFDAAIDVRGGFDAWLGRLPRHRRGSLRSELRALSAAGMTTAFESSASALAELAPILAAAEARHGHAFEPQALHRALERQRQALGDAFAISTVRDREGVLVAGAIALLDRDAISMRVCGVDRSRAGRHFEYFHACYYTPLRACSDSGRTRLHLGMTALEAKALRGAELEPRWGLDLGAQPRWRPVQARRHGAARLAELEPLRRRIATVLAPQRHAALATAFAEAPAPPVVPAGNAAHPC